MFSHKINAQTELRLIQAQHSSEFFKLMDANRRHLRPWHPWIDLVGSRADVDRMITGWLEQLSRNRGFNAGIWHMGTLCGSISHLNIDWLNRSTWLTYWLDEPHQGRGIMTAACRAFVTNAFDTLKLNRVTIECATNNFRSRRIPERLGFKLEGIVRGAVLLHGHFVDHAMYGLLKGDLASANSPGTAEAAPDAEDNSSDSTDATDSSNGKLAHFASFDAGANSNSISATSEQVPNGAPGVLAK